MRIRPNIDEIRLIFPNATRAELSAYYVTRAQHEYALLVSKEPGLFGGVREVGYLCQNYLKAASYFAKIEDLSWFSACLSHVWDVVEDHECEGFV